MKKIIRAIVVIVLLAALIFAAIQVGTHSKKPSKNTISKDNTEEQLPEADYWNLTVDDLEVLGYDGDALAQYVLGVTYDYGLNDTVQNFNQAYDWYEMAAQRNYGDAWCALGYMYLNGCGVNQSDEDAIDCFYQAVNNGCAKANAGIGKMYLSGYGEDSNRTQLALDYITRAYEANTIDGVYYYGYLLETGTGIEMNPSQALELYMKAASMTPQDVTDELAINSANTRIGMIYIDGKGVAKDEAAAITYMETAAENNYNMAQYYMGIIYENGMGTDVDYGKAMEWFQKAAEQDYAPALNQIGYLYFNGFGVDADYDQTVYYQKLSAAQGYAPAQVNLGFLYENGYGVDLNLETARAYYQLAADQNYEGAKEAVTRVQKLIEEQEEGNISKLN